MLFNYFKMKKKNENSDDFLPFLGIRLLQQSSAAMGFIDLLLFARFFNESTPPSNCQTASFLLQTQQQQQQPPPKRFFNNPSAISLRFFIC